MRAAQYSSFGDPSDVLAVAEAALPEPGPGEVRIRTVLASIHNHDLLTVRGLYGYKPTLPAIGGSEALGVVDAVGDGVEGLRKERGEGPGEGSEPRPRDLEDPAEDREHRLPELAADGEEDAGDLPDEVGDRGEDVGAVRNDRVDDRRDPLGDEPLREVEEDRLDREEEASDENLRRGGAVGRDQVPEDVGEVGEEVEVVGYNSDKKSVVTGVEMFRKLLDEGFAGDNVGLLLRGIDKKDIERGMVLAKPG